MWIAGFAKAVYRGSKVYEQELALKRNVGFIFIASYSHLGLGVSVVIGVFAEDKSISRTDIYTKRVWIRGQVYQESVGCIQISMHRSAV